MPLKKSKSKPKQLPLDMERAIRDYTADKNKVKETRIDNAFPTRN